MSYYYYNYDGPMDGETDYDTIFEETQPTYAWGTIYEACIVPSSLQIFWYMCSLIGWSFMGRVGLAIFARFQTKNHWILHTISTLAGCSMLATTVGTKSLIVAFIACISFMMLNLLNRFAGCRKNIGFIMVIFTLSAHLCAEIIWKQQVAWQIIKGSVMVTNMKIISVAFEIGASAVNIPEDIKPNACSYLGYIFMPSTLIIGPWVPFSSYLESICSSASRRLTMRWIVWCLLSSLISLSFLNLSNCIVPSIFSNRSPIWIRIFRDALAVRCSHYFVSFLSQASISAGGVSFNKDQKPNPLLGHMITQPLHIEFPRSLNAVVRTWNIPMHAFLKEYIFRGIYKRFGSQLLAVFVTYLVSSLLHGDNLKIYLVLLSLASFGYVELKLRAKIANAFNACVGANVCRKPCRFKYCSSHGWNSDCSMIVKLTNFLFSILSIFHLAYLGVIMNETTAEEEDTPEVTGYNDYLKTWYTVNFMNHWVVLFTYLVYLII